MKTGHTQRHFIISYPSIVGNYFLEDTISSGGNSIVIRAKRISTGELFAAKVVSRNYLVENGLLMNFEQEIRVHQTLDHPNIVKLYEIIYTEELIVLIQEFCLKGDLLDFVQNHGICPSSFARRMFYQLLCALSYIHSRNIAHLDLKLENILLDDDMNLKLTDFGCCQTNVQNTFSKTFGTLLYTPPEILLYIEYKPEKADVWSAGVILYTLVHGEFPWKKGSENAIRKQILSKNYVLPSSIEAEASDIIRMCIQYEPDSRPTIEELLNHHWLIYERKREIEKIEKQRKSNFNVILRVKGISMVDVRPTMRQPKAKIHPTLSGTPTRKNPANPVQVGTNKSVILAMIV